MPFVTEELRQRLVQALAMKGRAASISLERYPTAIDGAGDDLPFMLFQNIVTDAREQRADRKLDPKATVPANLVLKEYQFRREDLAILAKLTRFAIEQSVSSDLANFFELKINTGESESSAIRERAAKEKARLEKAIESHRNQLNNPAFMDNAPEKVIAGKRAKLAEYEAELAKNSRLLAEVQ
jgi:valyl-tRNA synthetase